jgi:hypothetical protein
LSHWDLRTDPDVDHPADIRDLQAHRRFGEALRHQAVQSLIFADKDPVHHRAFSDTGQFVLGLLALYLDTTGGITHRRLRELGIGLQTLSGGRTSALILQMRRIGYITPDMLAPGGRAQSYRPTPAMVAAFRDRLRIYLETAVLIEPQVGHLLARYDEPGVFRAVCKAYGRLLLNITHNNKSLNLEVLTDVASRRAGSLIVYSLLLEAQDELPFPSPGPVTINITRLAARLGVSRQQVQDVIRRLEDAGYYTRVRYGIDTVTQAFCKAYADYAAIILSGALIAANLAWRELHAEAALPKRKVL